MLSGQSLSRRFVVTLFLNPISLFVLQPSYNGKALVSVDCALTGAAFGLPLAEPITPLGFNVVPIVAVRASAYKIGTTTLSVPAPALAPQASDNPA